MVSSNVNGKVYIIVLDNLVDTDDPLFGRRIVVADNNFLDYHLHKLSLSSNETGNVVAANMFVDDHFQKLSNISNETRNFDGLFEGMPNLIISSSESAKVKGDGIYTSPKIFVHPSIETI
ncbi:hypothetical protein Hanom_Chr02g00133331 [Helianthus anomalus]